MTSTAIDAQRETPAEETKRWKPTAELWFVLAGLTLIYLVAAVCESRRFVWFDELFTFDIARSSSLHELWSRTLLFDNNPPLVYLLSRLSMKILGPTSLGLRLPSMLEFYFGSIAIFFYLRRKMGARIGSLGVLFLWSSGYFYYATEARPYALMFMAFAFVLLSWDTAVDNKKRGLALFGVSGSTALLLASHVFAPLSWFPFLVAEGVRFVRRRKPDYPLWGALLLPAAVMTLYIPLIRVYGGLIFSPLVRASWRQCIEFFSMSIFPPLRSFYVVVLVVLALLLLPAAKKGYQQLKPSAEEVVLFVFLLLNPALLTALLMHRHGGFFDRYCITTAVAVCVALTMLLAIRLRPGRLAVGAAALLLIALIALNVSQVRREPYVDAIPWASLRPDLPVVDASGMNFYEMNHHASSQLLSRLYYLKDRDASLRYDSTNYFQDFEAPDDMKRAGFPIAASVEPYSQFIQAHHQFLVFGNLGDWLLRELKHDGATETLAGDYTNISPYSFHSLVYLVTINHPIR